MLTRRQFLKLSAGAAGALFLSERSFSDPRQVLAYDTSLNLRRFVQPLRGIFPLDPNGIPVAVPDTTTAPVTGVTHYTLGIRQFEDTLYPGLNTRLWGYVPTRALGPNGQAVTNVTPRHLGGIIVVKKGTPIQLTFRNTLPNQHILPVDQSIMGVAGNQVNRTSVHNHGGLVPWISDGGPFAWWDPNGHRGVSFLNNQVLNPTAAPNEAEYYYPNNQSARMLWYHDHAIGITRLNAYAGIASAYIIRDDFESSLRNKGLPDFIENGGRELPIVIQDKVFVGGDINSADPSWPGPTTPGSLWYPHINEDALSIDPSVVPEMFGDTMLANGVVYPLASVDAARYRLRLLNACQSRFLNLQLYVADKSNPDGIILKAGRPINAKGPDFLVIGTEGGFLFRPVRIQSNRPFEASTPFDAASIRGSLITGPAERWDMIVDFRQYAGKRIIMYNDAPAPYPEGDPATDFFATTGTGMGPNTRLIMAFDVAGSPANKDSKPEFDESADLSRESNPFPVPLGVAVQNGGLKLPPGIKVRQLTLNEDVDEFGRLIQLLGTNVALSPGAFGRPYDSTPTESPNAGAVEVWQIANLTGDSHPIHFHLVNVLVLARQPFNVDTYDGTPIYTGKARGPERTELGWKETVQMHPGEVTTVVMKFDLPVVPFVVPPSPRTGGNEYVWHCHILEHEEHDMMRPLVVE